MVFKAQEQPTLLYLSPMLIIVLLLMQSSLDLEASVLVDNPVAHGVHVVPGGGPSTGW